MNVQLTDKIESIYRHTLALIRENGFHGTPMSMIAKRSDVAIGTIYHYFPSKEKLILELFFYTKRRINKYIFDNINQEISYKKQFSLVLQRFCAFQIQNMDEFSFLEQFYNSPFNEQAHEIHCALQQHEEKNLIDFLLKGMEVNELRNLDVQIIAAAYIGAAVTFSKSVIYGKLKFNQEHLDQLIEIIWNGVKQNKEYDI